MSSIVEKLSKIDWEQIDSILTCPVESGYYSVNGFGKNFAVTLIPCAHKIKQSMAEKIFGGVQNSHPLFARTESSLVKNKKKPCPLCKTDVKAYVTCYKLIELSELFNTDYEKDSKQLTEKQSNCLHRVRQFLIANQIEYSLNKAVSLYVMAKLEEIPNKVPEDGLETAVTVMPCGHVMSEARVKQRLASNLDCHCLSRIEAFYPDHTIRSLASLLKSYKAFATAVDKYAAALPKAPS